MYKKEKVCLKVQIYSISAKSGFPVNEDIETCIYSKQFEPRLEEFANRAFSNVQSETDGTMKSP